MKSGFNGVDFKDNINFDLCMRKARLYRAKKYLKESGLCIGCAMTSDNIRYITGTYVGEWNRIR